MKVIREAEFVKRISRFALHEIRATNCEKRGL
jgi:hypothetical protein